MEPPLRGWRNHAQPSCRARKLWGCSVRAALPVHGDALRRRHGGPGPPPHRYRCPWPPSCRPWLVLSLLHGPLFRTSAIDQIWILLVRGRLNCCMVSLTPCPPPTAFAALMAPVGSTATTSIFTRALPLPEEIGPSSHTAGHPTGRHQMPPRGLHRAAALG